MLLRRPSPQCFLLTSIFYSAWLPFKDKMSSESRRCCFYVLVYFLTVDPVVYLHHNKHSEVLRGGRDVDQSSDHGQQVSDGANPSQFDE
jgi:hypothetical protein